MTLNELDATLNALIVTAGSSASEKPTRNGLIPNGRARRARSPRRAGGARYSRWRQRLRSTAMWPYEISSPTRAGLERILLSLRIDALADESPVSGPSARRHHKTPVDAHSPIG